MIGQKEAMEKLKPSLTAAIQKWMDDVCETPAWGGLHIWVGENLASHMSDAAAATLGSVMDVQNYFRENNMLDE